jgi:hypothetical protein
LEILLLIEHLDFFTGGKGDLLVQSPGDPGMLQCSLGIISLDLTDAAQFAHEVLCQGGDVRWVIPFFGLDGRHLLLQRVAVVRKDPSSDVKRVVPGKHEKKDNTSSVHIYLFAVGMARDLLRSHKQDRADFLFMGQLDP